MVDRKAPVATEAVEIIRVVAAELRQIYGSPKVVEESLAVIHHIVVPTIQILLDIQRSDGKEQFRKESVVADSCSPKPLNI